MKKVVLLAAVMTLALMSVAASTASADYWRKCGSQPQTGAGWYYVKAHNISCRKARRVARRYQFDRTPFGFSCQSRPTGIESSRYFCRRELNGRVQKVRFTYGA